MGGSVWHAEGGEGVGGIGWGGQFGMLIHLTTHRQASLLYQAGAWPDSQVPDVTVV